MERKRIFATSMLGSNFRIERGGYGFLVTLSVPKPDSDAVSVTRWKFAPDEGDLAALRLLEAVIDHLGAHCERMRAQMLSALRRAVTAERTMRPGSSVVRQVKAQSVEIAERYFREGREQVMHCVEVERQLTELGFHIEVRTLPAWMDEVLRDPDHQNGTSSSAASESEDTEETGSSSSQPDSRTTGFGASR